MKKIFAFVVNNPAYFISHRLAIGLSLLEQAVVDYRLQAGITGPLFIGLDTHALSRPA